MVVTIPSLFGLAAGLSMDSFAVSAGHGSTRPHSLHRHALALATVFALFHIAAIVGGWLLGSAFRPVIAAWDHWVAFALLAGIGGQMLWGALHSNGDDDAAEPAQLGIRRLLALGTATSIDAMGIGLSLAFMDVSLPLAVGIVAIVVFALTIVGTAVGRSFGHLLGTRAELLGGLILVGIGTKILIEHTLLGVA